MARATFNDLTLEIPAGWEDASLITLLGPAPARERTLSARQVPGERPNLVLKRAAVSGPLPDLETFARLQEQAMLELAPGAQVVERGTLALDGLDQAPQDAPAEQAAGRARSPATVALTRVYSIPTPTNVTGQLQLYLQRGEHFYILCGTGLYDASFKALQEQFLAVARSLRFG